MNFNLYNLFLYSLFATFLCIPLSVSLGQLFLGLTFVFYIADKNRKPIQWSLLFKLSSLLFGLYLFSALVHFVQSGFSIIYLKSIKTSEIKDILLFFGMVLITNIKTEDFGRVQRFIWYSVLVLVITGFLSIFTPYRLGKMVTDLFTPTHTWKFTHHYGNLMNIGIHLPIGFMNTHLTYGGLLLIYTPFILFQTLSHLKKDVHIKTKLFYITIFILFLSVLVLNNARSAILGSAVAIFIGLIDMILFRKVISLKIVSRFIFVLLLIAGILGFALMKNEAFSKTILPLIGEKKHTDSGRTFIWNSTFPMIESNPIFGIGPGNYAKQVEIERRKLSEQDKELLFFYEVTQRGHAHNDYFHIAAISGLANSFVYLSIFLVGMYYISKLKQSNFLFYGLIGFGFAGMFQCYFQDDEVVILFWLLFGLLNRFYLEEYEFAQNNL